MCFITYNFVGRAKYEMGSLGFKPNNSNELTLKILNENVCHNLMRVKDIQKAFYVFSHYQWVRKHLKKISKAMQHKKWREITYSKCDVKRNNAPYDNVIIVTNIFSNKFNSIYCEDGLLKLEELKEQKSHDNKFEFIKYNKNIFLVFEKDYIKSIKKKELADENRAIALIENHLVDDKNGKCVVYIIFEDEIIKSPEILKYAIKKIKSFVNLANLNKYNMYMLGTSFSRRY